MSAAAKLRLLYVVINVCWLFTIIALGYIVITGESFTDIFGHTDYTTFGRIFIAILIIWYTWFIVKTGSLRILRKESK